VARVLATKTHSRHRYNFLGRLIIEISEIARIHQKGEKEIYNGKTIVVHESIIAPFSFFNAVYVSPEIRVDSIRFSKIFMHESTHIKYRHSVDTVLIEFICSLFWINPLVYVYKRALKAIHEYQADNVVKKGDLIAYTQLLLAQSQSGLRLVYKMEKRYACNLHCL
jgi:bla regulator protein blaR1